LAAVLLVAGGDCRGAHALAHRGRDDIPHGAELAKEVEEFLRGDVEARGMLDNMADGMLTCN